MGTDMPKECKNWVTVLWNLAKGGSENQKQVVKINLRGNVRGSLTLLLNSKIWETYDNSKRNVLIEQVGSTRCSVYRPEFEIWNLVYQMDYG